MSRFSQTHNPGSPRRPQMTHGGLNCDHMEPTHQLSHTNTTHQLSHINTTHKLPHINTTHINIFENIRTILNRFHQKCEDEDDMCFDNI